MLQAINHIAIIVSDLDASKVFYIDKLGFPLIHQIDRPERQSTILYLDAGSCIIELFSFPNPPKQLSYPEACGLRHLAFNAADFDETVAKLNALGVETETIRIDARTGKKMTFCHDPDGLPIEICEI